MLGLQGAGLLGLLVGGHGLCVGGVHLLVSGRDGGLQEELLLHINVAPLAHASDTDHGSINEAGVVGLVFSTVRDHCFVKYALPDALRTLLVNIAKSNVFQILIIQIFVLFLFLQKKTEETCFLAEILLFQRHAVVGQAAEVQLVNRIAGVPDQFPQKNFLMGINAVDHQIKEPFGLRFELFCRHGPAPPK